MHIKDSMEQTENYRPISLLRIISKVLERWVSIKLYNHGKQFVSPLQHGFLRNRFCTTQLLSVNAISRNLDKNIQTEVIYLDLAKAFDSVDHWVILQKLKRYGAEGGTLLWFTDYLSRGFGKCCLVTAPSYIGSSSGQPTWSSFICSLYWQVTACAWGEGSGCSYFGQAYLRPTFTPDYSKSKQTSIWAKVALRRSRTFVVLQKSGLLLRSH